MTPKTHPNDVLFGEERPFPIIPSCEHIVGDEKKITKALELQNAKGGIFDITMDLEDGASTGREKEHAEKVVSLLKSPLNHHMMSGVRIHDYRHPHWRKDVEIIIPNAGDVVRYITLPKPTHMAQIQDMISFIQRIAKRSGNIRKIPIHVMIETHGALRDIFEIAALPWMSSLDFGLLDFVAAHHGAIPESYMHSPGQFEHPLIVRAKTRVVTAALSNGIIPSHNVTLDLKDRKMTFADAQRARNEFGFLRMWSVHPTQIDPIVEAMMPDSSLVKKACEILLMAQKKNWGPIEHGGQLHDRATYRYFWQLVRTAHLAGQGLPNDAEEAFFLPE